MTIVISIPVSVPAAKLVRFISRLVLRKHRLFTFEQLIRLIIGGFSVIEGTRPGDTSAPWKGGGEDAEPRLMTNYPSR